MQIITHISKEHERSLIKNYQEYNSQEAIEELLESHGAYIQYSVSKFYKNINKSVEFEDLLQQAKIGMLKAAKQFDLNKKSINPTKENSKPQYLRFLTYAHSWILAEMQTLWHHSHTVHIPAHTLRMIHFKLSADGPQNDLRKKNAKLAMNAESLDAIKHAAENIYSSTKMQDPTFEEAIKYIYSPNTINAISKLNDIDWKIFKMKTGVEDGFKHSYPDISRVLNLPIIEVDKRFKKAKRVLVKYTKRTM